jgi:hypothetical protein
MADEVWKLEIIGRITPIGIALEVNSDPKDMHGDQMLDLCLRAARFIERQLGANMIVDVAVNRQMRAKGIVLP